MAHVRMKSLRTRFLTLLALGGSLVASAGLWITYTTTVGLFEAQLVERGRLLADTLNHSAMVADTPMQVQHVVDELSLSPYINNIMIVTSEPLEIMVSSKKSWNGTLLVQLPDRHLGEHLFEILANGDFGHHFNDEGDTLILTVPLDPQMIIHQGRDASIMSSSAAPEHGMAPERGPNHVIEPTTEHDRIPYRGVIMLDLDNREASAASSQILWLLCTALVAAVLIMMSIAYVIVDRQILDRLTVIRRAMIGQDSNTDAIPIPVTANDEIGDLGRTFNSMIDRIDGETRRREGAVKGLRDSEERFRSVVDNSPTKIHIKDVERRYVLINREAEKLFGLNNEEARGKTAHEIFPDKRAEKLEAHDRAVLETGRTIEQEEQWELDDGVHTYLTVKFPIRDGDGEIVAIGAIGTDITERKQVERLSQRLGRILDSSFNEIYVFDAQSYRFSQVNQGALSNLGYTMQELIHMTPWDLKPEFDKDSFGAAIEPLHRGEREMLVFETEHRRKNGTLYPVEVRLQLSRSETPPVFVAVIADISVRKLAEKAVHAAKEEAERANRAKSEFLATMSHELRTPLNAIIGFSEIIKDERLGPVGSTKYREYADDINESGQHLLALINDILDLSKVESGTDDLHEENIEISQVAKAILKLVVGLARKGNVELELDVSDDIPLLYADERNVKQILLNLLSNAIKFTPDGGKVTLRIWSRAESGYVFQVTDTGIGIAFEDIPKALAPFQQIDSGLNRKHEGTGLGLPLTKSLVELHGGYLDLQSKIGVGTTVTVRFPAERIVRSAREAEAVYAADRKAG
ncbi:MAG: PAS domain S-box protein [Alphaproteobacteria bacterium]|nr:PAS domain S-box protein [Alphaproteobacteria bacterium]